MVTQPQGLEACSLIWTGLDCSVLYCVWWWWWWMMGVREGEGVRLSLSPPLSAPFPSAILRMSTVFKCRPPTSNSQTQLLHSEKRQKLLSSSWDSRLPPIPHCPLLVGRSNDLELRTTAATHIVIRARARSLLGFSALKHTPTEQLGLF